MKISTLMSYAHGFRGATQEVVELEKAGLDVVWVPEAYSFDAVSAMGYIAAKQIVSLSPPGYSIFIAERRP